MKNLRNFLRLLLKRFIYESSGKASYYSYKDYVINLFAGMRVHAFVSKKNLFLRVFMFSLDVLIE